MPHGDIGVISPYRAQVISASIYDKHSGSTKITTHLDHISRDETTPGTSSSNRWTCGVVNGDIGVISPYRAQVYKPILYKKGFHLKL
jgi:hypothetical protein